ncbi:MAG: fimbria/pilus periplasmic chaperone [Bacteroidota bacterium]|nr:fimbria/pilus periplasmic chaperone [Bacteroidota bacterium]
MMGVFKRNPIKTESGQSYTLLTSLFIVGFCFFGNVYLFAQGNLQIEPHRIIFDGQKKTMNVNLANTGQDSASYSISFLQYRMTDDGTYEEITTPDPGQYFADKNIRFFPRSVTLGPNETQIVKIQLVNSEQLQAGEYRSHLYFRALPKQKALGEEVKPKDTSSISIRIVPIFGISIPVLIRVGESTTTLNFSDLRLEKNSNGGESLLLTVHRSGNMSAIGDIVITHIDATGKEVKIGALEGIVIYTPNLLRRFKIDLDNKPSIDMTKGRIRVVFDSKLGANIVKQAEAELAL